MRQKMPKALKYDLGEKCLDSGLNCMRKIIEANSQIDKKQTLKELSTEIDVLWTWIRLLYDFKGITTGEFKILCERLTDISNQTTGWSKWEISRSK